MNRLLNIPNSLTFARLILSGFVFYFILLGDRITALILFSVAALTELDGTIARKLKQETVFGNYFDAITDIFWLVGTFIAFVIVGAVPPWFVLASIFFLLAITISVRRISKKLHKPVDISFHKPTDMVAGFFIILYLISLFFEFSSTILPTLATVAITISSFYYWKKAL